jgi:3-phosphoshikimate 1-carboxyvinyltransferase
VLLLAALADGSTRIRQGLEAHDTQVMRQALIRLGVPVSGWSVQGENGKFPAPGDLAVHCGDAGTTARFLLPAVALRPAGATTTLDGGAQIRSRPMGSGLQALRQAGLPVRCLEAKGHLPVVVPGGGLPAGPFEVDGTISSQFLSGLVMAAAASGQATTLRPGPGGVVSAPYLRMTIRLLERFGVTVEEGADGSLRVPGGGLRPPRGGELEVEPDASSASYFLAAGHLTGGEVCVPGAGADSLQPDARFPELLAALDAGATHLELEHCPDLAMTVAVVVAFGGRRVTLDGLQTLRHKECDRLQALAGELGRLGAGVIEGGRSLTIDPASPYQGPVTFETHGDHRMAMSLALCGLRVDGVRIRDPGVVAKTYPGFWDDLAALTGTVTVEREPEPGGDPPPDRTGAAGGGQPRAP